MYSNCGLREAVFSIRRNAPTVLVLSGISDRHAFSRMGCRGAARAAPCKRPRRQKCQTCGAAGTLLIGGILTASVLSFGSCVFGLFYEGYTVMLYLPFGSS